MIKRWLMSFAVLLLISGNATAQMTFAEGLKHRNPIR
jgi:hypothetical protein